MVTPSPVSSAEPGEAPRSSEKKPLSLPSSPLAVLKSEDPQCQPTAQQQLLPDSQSLPPSPQVAAVQSLPSPAESKPVTLSLLLKAASDVAAVKAESSDERQPVTEAVAEAVQLPFTVDIPDIPESPVSSAPSDIPEPYMSPEQCALWEHIL